jgi:amino acid transporter
MAMAVVVGTVIGSGVFKKPQQVALNVEYFGLAALVWILGGVLVFLGASALAEVSVLYPRAGGNYVFLKEGYGRMAGFLWGWVEFWIIRGASISALAVIFAESLHDILGNSAFQETFGTTSLGARPLGFWYQQWLTVVVIMGLALVNVRGVQWGGVLQLFITTVKVASLLGILALPFVVAALAQPESATPRPEVSRLSPVWPADWSTVAFTGLGTALLGVLWAYHGWMNLGWVAEEIREPQRNIPRALLGGVIVIIALYLGANLAYYLIIPRAEMARLENTTVATEFCRRLLGPIGAVAASAAVMCSVFGALNGNLMVGPRMLYAMGEDGLAPRVLGEVHPRYRTPAAAILVLAVWSSLLVLGAAALTRSRLPTFTLGGWEIDLNVPTDKSVFDILTDFAMFGAVIFETMAVLSIFVFRRTQPDAPRPYRCWGYPVVPLLYVLLPGMVLANMFFKQRAEVFTGTAFILLGMAVYWFTFRARGAKSVA